MSLGTLALSNSMPELCRNPLLEDAQRLIHIVVAQENLHRRAHPGWG